MSLGKELLDGDLVDGDAFRKAVYKRLWEPDGVLGFEVSYLSGLRGFLLTPVRKPSGQLVTGDNFQRHFEDNQTCLAFLKRAVEAVHQAGWEIPKVQEVFDPHWNKVAGRSLSELGLE